MKFNQLTSLLFLLTCLVMFKCENKKKQKEMATKKLDVQGHRGARGLMPENTIPAFIKALELDVTTLELDLAVTKDLQLLVSHESYMNPEMCLDSLGKEILDENKYAFKIYQMSYDQVKSFDCGMKNHPRFLKQEKMAVTKPLLKDVVNAVNKHISESKREDVYYNIEIKTNPEGDELFHPSVEVFSDLVYEFIQESMNPDFVNVQSFDFRVLQYFHKKYPEVKLAMLIESEANVDTNLAQLGFVPEIYSCDYHLLSQATIAYIQTKEMRVIPWTVNNIATMNQLIAWDIDGIITDYPDSLQSILSK